MEKGILYYEPYILPLSYETWLWTLGKPLQERPKYRKDGQILHYGQVVARFIGLPHDEDEYYNQLFTMVNERNLNLSLLSEETLQKEYDKDIFQAVQKFLIEIGKEIQVHGFITFLEDHQFFSQVSHLPLRVKMKEGLTKTLQLFSSLEKDGLESPELGEILAFVLTWTKTHYAPSLENFQIEKGFPKYLWYGNFNKSHQYFLYFLIQLGCDVVTFHPKGEDPLENLEKMGESSFVYYYPNKKEPEPFPEGKRERLTTIGYRASKEIEMILYIEGSYFYKPWQLRDYTPQSVTLKTTYDELFLIGKEISIVRPYFLVKDKVVKIPNLFAKVQGVSRNRKAYWDNLHQLVENKNSILIRQFPFTRSLNTDFRFHYKKALDSEGLLEIEIMLKSTYWPYSHLPYGLQKGIGTAIRNICKKPALKPIYRESEEELKTFLFTQSMQIPEKFLQLLQKFDYSGHVPKVVIFNNEMNGIMTRTDACLLLLLNQFGVDIIVYNPQGHNDLENFIDDKMFDTHWLEEVVFELEYKEPSFLRKIFRYLRRD